MFNHWRHWGGSSALTSPRGAHGHADETTGAVPRLTRTGRGVFRVTSKGFAFNPGHTFLAICKPPSCLFHSCHFVIVHLSHSRPAGERNGHTRFSSPRFFMSSYLHYTSVSFSTFFPSLWGKGYKNKVTECKVHKQSSKSLHKAVRLRILISFGPFPQWLWPQILTF